MKDGYIKVAAISPKVTVADVVSNTKEICKKMEECYEAGARIMVFPELALTGYTCQDLFYQERMIELVSDAIQYIAEFTVGYQALIFVGMPLEYQNKLYNVAAVFYDGRLLAFVPKKNIPNYSEYYEVRQFASWDRPNEEVDFAGAQVLMGNRILFQGNIPAGLVVGCELCEDLWVANPPSTELAQAGATLIVNLSASNEIVGKSEYRRQLVSMTSARLVSGYIYASAGCGESTQDLVFGGHRIIAENGNILAECRPFSNVVSKAVTNTVSNTETGKIHDDICLSDIDISRLRFDRRRMNTYMQAEAKGFDTIRFILEDEECQLSRKYAKHPFVPADKNKREERCEEILNIQAFGLKKRLEHTHCKDVVIGISGGLDSTLALLVAVKAFDLLGLDRKGIHAITMPCFGTTDRTYDNACKLSLTLGASLKEVDIKEAVRLHFRDIEHDESNHNVVYENGQARERTQILMDIANQVGGLVIGTGDMSELALGWATYNGDHMSMYGVNAGVPKTLVRHLVRFYADTCGNEELSGVLLDVLDTPVSPELLPPTEGQISQKTEDLVGPYELHDFFLYYMLRLGFTPEKIRRIAIETFVGDYEIEVIDKWLKIFVKRFFAQHFKRSCLPDGPKVGTVAVSPRGDLRMPTDASSAGWLAQLEVGFN